MSKKTRIDTLSIKGFKSIRNLKDFRLGRLNVLLGANGAGKSSFVSYFSMLSQMMEQRFQKWTTQQGSADRIVSFGLKETTRVESFIRFGLNGYKFELETTVDGAFVFASEKLFFNGPLYGPRWVDLSNGHTESKLKDTFLEKNLGSPWKNDTAAYCYESISSWKVYHFHDTSDQAGVKRYGPVHINQHLSPDASNLAAYLYRLKNEEPNVYQEIRKTIQLAVPCQRRLKIDPLFVGIVGVKLTHPGTPIN